MNIVAGNMYNRTMSLTDLNSNVSSMTSQLLNGSVYQYSVVRYFLNHVMQLFNPATAPDLIEDHWRVHTQKPSVVHWDVLYVYDSIKGSRRSSSCGAVKMGIAESSRLLIILNVITLAVSPDDE